MKLRHALVFLVFFFFCLPSMGQEKTIERKFLNARDRIRKNKVRQITERAGCDNGGSRILHEYYFDDYGNLAKVKDYLANGFRTVTYSRNLSGDYLSKDNAVFTLSGLVKSRTAWNFERNADGQIIKEVLMDQQKTLRTNLIEYDASGRIASETTSGDWAKTIYKWTLLYDNVGNLVDFREWAKDAAFDTFRCLSITANAYRDGVLIHRQVSGAESAEVWNDFSYTYDRDSYLVGVTEKRAEWTRVNDGPTVRSVKIFREVYSNDAHGNPLTKSVFKGDDQLPNGCVFYEYVQW